MDIYAYACTCGQYSFTRKQSTKTHKLSRVHKMHAHDVARIPTNQRDAKSFLRARDQVWGGKSHVAGILQKNSGNLYIPHTKSTSIRQYTYTHC